MRLTATRLRLRIFLRRPWTTQQTSCLHGREKSPVPLRRSGRVRSRSSLASGTGPCTRAQPRILMRKSACRWLWIAPLGRRTIRTRGLRQVTHRSLGSTAARNGVTRESVGATVEDTRRGWAATSRRRRARANSEARSRSSNRRGWRSRPRRFRR